MVMVLVPSHYVVSMRLLIYVRDQKSQPSVGEKVHPFSQQKDYNYSIYFLAQIFLPPLILDKILK